MSRRRSMPERVFVLTLLVVVTGIFLVPVL